MRFLLLSLLLVIGFWEGQGGRASVRRKRQLIDYHRDLRCSFWGLDCLAVGSYTVIRNDEGNQRTTALVVLPDYGDISSPTNTQRSQAQTAISQLTDGMLQNDPNLFITGLTTVGTSDNGVRIDQQGKTSDGWVFTLNAWLLAETMRILKTCLWLKHTSKSITTNIMWNSKCRVLRKMMYILIMPHFKPKFCQTQTWPHARVWVLVTASIIRLNLGLQ